MPTQMELFLALAFACSFRGREPRRRRRPDGGSGPNGSSRHGNVAVGMRFSLRKFFTRRSGFGGGPALNCHWQSGRKAAAGKPAGSNRSHYVVRRGVISFISASCVVKPSLAGDALPNSEPLQFRTPENDTGHVYMQRAIHLSRSAEPQLSPNAVLHRRHSSCFIASRVSAVRPAASLFSAARRSRNCRHSGIVPQVAALKARGR